MRQILFLVTLFLASCNLFNERKNVQIDKISGQTSIPVWSVEAAASNHNDMWMNREGSEGWAVGEDGIIFRYQNETWAKDVDASTVSEKSLFSIWMNPEGSEGWAVGSYGTILRYQDETWAKDVDASAFSDGWLYSIWMNPEGSEGWAVGYGGTILRYQDETWAKDVDASTISEMNLFSVSMNREGSEGWAVGYDGTILRYQDETWAKDVDASAISEENLLSIWMNPEGSEGWAIGSYGTILRYQNETWKKYVNESTVSRKTLRSIRMNPEGSEGWAVGNDGTILRYQNETWKKYVNASTVSGKILRSIWMNPEGSEGWVVGDGGTILRYQNETWKKYVNASTVSGESLFSICINPEGSEGWAVGSYGTILRYQDETWANDVDASTISDSWLYSIWMNPEGSEGWAVGYGGTILRYQDETWAKDVDASSISEENLLSIWMNPEGSEGWVVGDGGTILRYQDETWANDVDASTVSDSWLYSIWMNPEGSEGWAVGHDGTVLRYQDETWANDVDASSISEENLFSIWMNSEGSEGWAVGSDGTVLRYQDETWAKDVDASTISEMNLFSVSMNREGSEGWAVGYDGTILRYQDETWARDVDASAISVKSLLSIWMNQEGSEGWVVGEDGNVLKCHSESCLKIAVQVNNPESINDLSGTYAISGKYPITNVVVELLRSDGVSDIPLPSTAYAVEKKSDTLHTISFNGVQSLLKGLSNKECFLRLTISYDIENTSVTTTYDLEPFYIEERPMWHFAAAGVFGLAFFYLVLVLLAIPFSPVRKVILHPVGGALISAYLGKVLWIDALIRFVRPIRLGLFRDYRNQLNKAPYIVKWDQRNYVQPQISFRNGEKASTIEDVLNVVLKGEQKRLWLVIGKSGLGKSALLENWAKLSLDKGRTPVYIPLGSDLSAEGEVAAAFGQHGEVNVTPNVAFDLLNHGGFVVLLDGFNEDNTPEQTREFVRQVSKRNWVIMTSQFDPVWDNSVVMDHIDLKPFGREQLVELMDEKWVDELMQSDFAPLAGIPQTAELIGEFVEQNNRLPDFYLDLFRRLREVFDTDSQAINLEKKAWEMFKVNGKHFEPDDLLPKTLCEQAVSQGILTRLKNQYQFRHERVFRYFAACHLNRLVNHSLSELHKELREDLTRGYWDDLIELWGEMFAEEAIKDSSKENQLISFLKEVGEFNPKIFSTRLYKMYVRLYESGKVSKNSEFIEWSAKLGNNVDN